MSVVINSHKFRSVFEIHSRLKMSISKTDAVILLYDATKPETFFSLKLHFEELLFHCSDGVSDMVVTAIVCNEANVTSQNSSVKINRKQRDEMETALTFRRREENSSRKEEGSFLGDMLKEKAIRGSVALLIIADRRGGLNLTHPIRCWLRENMYIHRKLVFGSINTKTGKNVLHFFFFSFFFFFIFFFSL